LGTISAFAYRHRKDNVYVNSNQNSFQFHESHYKYEKGARLGLPIFRSIFQNFLQNLES